MKVRLSFSRVEIQQVDGRGGFFIPFTRISDMNGDYIKFIPVSEKNREAICGIDIVVDTDNLDLGTGKLQEPGAIQEGLFDT
jgi:hypothetical protein